METLLQAIVLTFGWCVFLIALLAWLTYRRVGLGASTLVLCALLGSVLAAG